MLGSQRGPLTYPSTKVQSFNLETSLFIQKMRIVMKNMIGTSQIAFLEIVSTHTMQYKESQHSVFVKNCQQIDNTQDLNTDISGSVCYH